MSVSANTPIMAMAGAAALGGKGVAPAAEAGEGGLFAQVLAAQAILEGKAAVLPDAMPLPALIAQAGLPGLAGRLTAQTRTLGTGDEAASSELALLQASQGAPLLAGLFPGLAAQPQAGEASPETDTGPALVPGFKPADVAAAGKDLPAIRPGLAWAGQMPQPPELAADGARAVPDGTPLGKAVALGREGGLSMPVEALAVQGDAEEAPGNPLTVPREAPGVRAEHAHLPAELHRPGASARHEEVTALALRTPFKAPGWEADLGQKIVWLAGRNTQFAELTLNPPHLGSLEVRLTLTGQDAGAQFFSANPVVREALEAAMPRLREMLAGVGLSLGQATVSQESFRQRQPEAASPPALTVEAEGPAAQPESAWVSARGLMRGLVDLYA